MSQDIPAVFSGYLLPNPRLLYSFNLISSKSDFSNRLWSFESALSITAVLLDKSSKGSWNETGYSTHAALVVLFAVFVFFLFVFL